MTRVRGLGLGLGLLAGCTAFENPALVLDLRVLAMSATGPDGSGLGPEQVIDFDLERPPTSEQLLAQLQPTLVCALVADPDQRRELRWEMTLCLLDEGGRCDRGRPFSELGGGVIADPEEAAAAQHPCAEVFPSPTLLALLRASLDQDPVQALGGIDYAVALTIGGVDDDRAHDVYATKRLRISPRQPATRQPNRNPFIDLLDAAELGIGLLVPPARCANQPDGFDAIAEVDAGSVVTLFPVEPPAVREAYEVPMLDGEIARLTETVEYQWLAGRGSFSDEFTGGGHDVLGNQSLLGTEWRAPAVNTTTYVPIWMVQRDERYGVTWLETCVKVTP